MKKNYYTLFILGMLTLSISAVAQKTVVVVEPDEGLNIGALNDAVSNAADPGNTIFELRRGGHYLLNGSISHEGYTLHIRAEDGDGPRPLLQTAVDENGASDNHFNPAGDITLEGLYIQSKDELGALERRQIIVGGDGNRVIIDDCYFDYGSQSILRLTSGNNKIYIRNCIIRNVLTPEKGNGRIIDNRSNPQDTILIENSTLYNFYAATVRFGNALVKSFIFDHNTVFQAHHWSGWVLNYTLDAKITNNIFYNYALAGDPHAHSPLFWSDSIFTIGEYTDADRSFDLSNNNWYSEQVFGDILEESYPLDVLYRFEPEDTDQSDTIWYKATPRTDLIANATILDTALVDIPTLVKFIEAGQADTTNNFSEQLTFKNPPPLITDYWEFFAASGFSIGSVGEGEVPSPYADENPDILGEITENAFDFSYNESSISATADKDGGPLGDPRWATYVPSSARDIVSSKSVTAYPNPFSETVTFGIESQQSASAEIRLFDMLGKEIVSYQKQNVQGYTSVQLNFKNEIKQGVYLYQVRLTRDDGSSKVSYGKLIRE